MKSTPELQPECILYSPMRKMVYMEHETEMSRGGNEERTATSHIIFLLKGAFYESNTSRGVQKESVLDAEESLLRVKVFLLPVLGLAEAKKLT